MRKFWRQFKSFALGGSMMDLALGIIIGTAFSTVIDSATSNLFTPLLGAAGGGHTKDLAKYYFTVGGVHVTYGAFLGDVINFLLFALILFLLVKFLASIGAGRRRSFEERQCPYCLEWINPDALVCKECRHDLVPRLPSLADAEARAAKLREHHVLDIPGIDIKDIVANVEDVLDGPDETPVRKRTAAKKAAPAKTAAAAKTAAPVIPAPAAPAEATAETVTPAE